MRYAAVYRCNMARSGGTIKPFSVLTDHLPLSSPQLYPDPHARPFVPVGPAAGEVMARVLRGLPVRSSMLRFVKLWRLHCLDLRSLAQVFMNDSSGCTVYLLYIVGSSSHDIEWHYVLSSSRILFDVLGFGGAVLCGILRIVKRVVRVQS